MKRMTLRNSFHNTSCVILTSQETERDAWLEIQYDAKFAHFPTKAAKKKYRRVYKALCGMTDCKCGTVR